MKKIWVNIIRGILFVLFVYASTAKLADFSLFNVQLKQSPLIPIAITGGVAYFIPGLEILIAILLIPERTARIGLFLSFFLMLLFSFYLIILVAFFEKVPCSCGGILGHMGYPAHITFNLVITIIALIPILFYPNTNDAEFSK